MDEVVKIAVYDAAGRKIQTLNARVSETIRFGKKLKTEVYFAEVIQGNKRRTVKLIKQ